MSLIRSFRDVCTIRLRFGIGEARHCVCTIHRNLGSRIHGTGWERWRGPFFWFLDLCNSGCDTHIESIFDCARLKFLLDSKTIMCFPLSLRFVGRHFERNYIGAKNFLQNPYRTNN